MCLSESHRVSLGHPCWFQEESLSVKKIHLNRSCTHKKSGSSFFFLSACPSHPGLPNTCLCWRNINRIARFLSINCCLTVPAKDCMLSHFSCLLFFLAVCYTSNESLQHPQMDLHVFCTLPWTENQLCSPELKWIQNWGSLIAHPIMLLSHQVGVHHWGPKNSQLAHTSLYWSIIKLPHHWVDIWVRAT